MHHSIGEPIEEGDGTYLIKYNSTLLPPCTKATVTWGGTTSTLRIPFVVSGNVDSETLFAARDGAGQGCDTCDVYVMEGSVLTISGDRTLHTLTIPDGAMLSVADGATLTVNSLVLFSEGDQSAPMVDLNNTGSIVLKNDELYHDSRIDESRYYWLTLPFDASLREISYSNEAANGKLPVYRTDYWVKYYNGALRAADANGGELANTYWNHVAAKGGAYTLRAGQGYTIGIKNQANEVQADGKKHTKRVMRFTMRPNENTWNTQERESSKTAPVVPSNVDNERNAVHAGWNLIGNPYMKNYSFEGSGGIHSGAWIEETDVNGVGTGWYILDEGRETSVPYLTVYDPQTRQYSQMLASSFRDLRPFEALFVQVNSGTSVNFTMASAVKPVKRRFGEPEAPLYTGIMLSGNEQTDRTGVVLSDEFSANYEIGGDLCKTANAGKLNLYTFNADNQTLAFNGLSDEDAIEPIPVGVTFPSGGMYTFAFDAEQYSLNELDTLQVIDYVEGVEADLLHGEYNFFTQAGKVDNRFALIVRRAKSVNSPTVTTSLEKGEGNKGGWRKVVRDGVLYIVNDDKTYDALGNQVCR